MPHIIVKLYPGRPENQKMQLTDKIVRDVMNTLNSAEESISVSFEEIAPKDWAEQVYKPEILNKSEKLYKKPGYNPFE